MENRSFKCVNCLNPPALPRIIVLFVLLCTASSGTAFATDSLVTGVSCTEKALYLEDSLAPRPDPAYCANCKRESAEQFFGIRALAREMPPTGQSPLPQQCFTAAMSLRPTGRDYHYASCEGAKSSTHGRQPPPCVTPALTSSVQTALQQTTNCLGIDEKEVFSLFGWESSFQLNEWSLGGVGVGQLTSVAVADVDLHRRFAQDLGKAECAPFEGIFEESAENYRKLAQERGRYPRIKPCAWMAPPDNPAKNLLYAEATYGMDKSAAESLARGIGRTPRDREEIAIDLARYMYNGGLGGVRNVFRMFLLRSKARNMTHSQFTKAFSSYLGTHYQENDADERAKEIVSNYAQKVSVRQKLMEKLTKGLQCTE